MKSIIPFVIFSFFITFNINARDNTGKSRVLRLLKILEIYTVIMIFKLTYNEKINAQKLGFEYYSLPVYGNNDYTPEKLDAFASPINKDDRILIHCLSAGRATTFFMAYLIKNKGYTINKATDIGRNLRFSFPLEMLLGAKISMEIIK